MRIPTYVFRSRHGIFFFRIVVPRALREFFDGRCEIKRSLHTRDLRVALREARPLSLEIYAAFDRLGAGMSGPKPTVADILANADKLRDLKVEGHLWAPDGKVLPYSIEATSNDPAELAALERTADRYVEAHAKQVAAAKLPEISAERAALIAHERAEIARALDEHRLTVEGHPGAVPKIGAGKPAQTEAPAPVVQPLTPAASADQAEAPIRFTHDPENVATARWAEYFKQSKGISWAAGRSPKAASRMFNEFVEWWGRDGDIRAIDRKLINRFITHLTTHKRIEKGRRAGELGLNVRTVDNYTSVLNTFLEWAQNKGYFPDDRRLPTAKQAMVSRADRHRLSEKANPAFTAAQLRELFHPENYKPDLAHHFWPPLIALFTGARRREIAQLLIEDIEMVDDIAAISINILGDEDKSLKTRAARRMIPIHPVLLDLGLLEYVEDVKALDLGPELFPAIGANIYGEKGNALGQAWRRHRENHDMAGSRQPTFHSFRPTALQVLKKNGVEFEMRCQLAGHEMDHVSVGYDPNPFSVQQLWERGIPKLTYPTLDLTPLKYKRGQFDKTNRSGTVRARRSELRIKAKAERAAANAVAAETDRIRAGKG